MKKLYLFLTCLFALLLCGMSVEAQAADKIPDGAVTFQGHSYYKFDNDMSWQEAQAYCTELGGNLATLTTKEENDFVMSLLSEHSYDAYWLGAFVTDTGWEWVNGEAFDYTNFWPGQPDQAQPGMVLQAWYRGTDEWMWDDTWNDGDIGGGEVHQGFVCEWGDTHQVLQYVDMKYLSGAKNDYVVYSAMLNEQYFKSTNSMSVAKQGLLKLSALGALTTYSENEKGQTPAFLSKCGFNDVEKIYSGTGVELGHSTKDDNNHGTIYCGWMDLSDGQRLFALVVSGYSEGGYEWISNFYVGLGKNHAGFDLAADELEYYASRYMALHGGKSGAKVWIMGHSRGGALTNLLAIKLCEDTNNRFGVKVETKNVFAYGFATPQYTSSTYKGYDNAILNFVSPHDFVPCVVPTKWGFKRAGTNTVFSNAKKMKSTYKTLTGHKYRGYTEKQKNALIKEFNNFGKSQKKYVNGYTVNADKSVLLDSLKDIKYTVKPQEYGMYGIGLTMVSSSLDTASGASKMLATKGAGTLNKKLIDGASTSKIADAHEMMAYISWIAADYN